MASIRAFRPYTFSPSTTHELSELISPPYDVISPEELQALRESNSHNITRVILPAGSDDVKYQNAAQTLQAWLNDRVIEETAGSGLFPYAQTFDHPETGAPVTRRGFVCLLELVDFDEGIVLPHERTLRGPKEDRLNLMRATKGNLEPIFGMYPDSDGKPHRALYESAEKRGALIDVVDASGTRHQLWQASNDESVQAMSEELKQSKVFIIDGHHRYETGLAYRDEVADSDDRDLVNESRYIMIFLVPASDPGLIILPTHRVVHSVPDFDLADLIEKLSLQASVDPADSAESALQSIEESTEPKFALLSTVRSYVISPRIPADASPSDALDVNVCHRLILENGIGMTLDDIEEQRYIRYIKGSSDIDAELDKNDTQVIVAMRPPTIQQVVDVSESGGVMPQKSTFFWPKLASGLLMNLFTSNVLDDG